MKVLFDHSTPFLLAHGGVQLQIEQTRRALEAAHVEAGFVRWWDIQQKGDVIHYFGTIPPGYIRLARQKGIPIILTTFLSATCNRTDLRLRIQGIVTRTLLRLPGWASLIAQLQWLSFQQATHVVVGLEAERDALQTIYGTTAAKISVVPLGLDSIYREPCRPKAAGDHLISVGTIRDIKRSIDLAELAHLAQVPILFVGNPYSTTDEYWHRFQALIDNHFVLYQPHIDDPAEIKRKLCEARGFVLYSEYENWSLAAHEAAACGLPLLVPGMKWSRECFDEQASYFCSGESKHSAQLRSFYLSAEQLPSPKLRHHSWHDVARQLIRIYETVLDHPSNTSL